MFFTHSDYYAGFFCFPASQSLLHRGTVWRNLLRILLTYLLWFCLLRLSLSYLRVVLRLAQDIVYLLCVVFAFSLVLLRINLAIHFLSIRMMTFRKMFAIIVHFLLYRFSSFGIAVEVSIILCSSVELFRPYVDFSRATHVILLVLFRSFYTQRTAVPLT